MQVRWRVAVVRVQVRVLVRIRRRARIGGCAAGACACAYVCAAGARRCPGPVAESGRQHAARARERAHGPSYGSRNLCRMLKFVYAEVPRV
jgi:hypothetical protein